MVFNNGFIIQWGYFNNGGIVADSTSGTVKYPISFSHIGISVGIATGSADFMQIYANNYTGFSFSIYERYVQGEVLHAYQWIAVGL